VRSLLDGVKHEWKTAGAWVVFVVAFAVRLAWIAYVHPMPQSDFLWYQNEAISILHGQGYQFHGRPTAYFPIGYPLFLSVVYAAFGVHWLSGVLANICLSALTASLVYAAAYRQFGRFAGWIGGLLMALYLPHIEWSSVLCSEMLFTFLFFLSYYLWVCNPLARTSLLMWVASGVTLGLACVVRPVALLAPGALFLYLLLNRIGFWKSVKYALVVVAAMCVTISPVTVRNYIHFHHLVLVSTNGGVNLWQGNNPYANGAYYWPSNPTENPFLQYVENEVADNQKASHMAWTYISEHPGATIRLGFVKWYHLFQGVDNADNWSMGHSVPPVSKTFHATIRGLSLAEYRCVLLLAGIGVVLQVLSVLRRRDRRPLLGLFVALYYIGLFFLFPAWDRMRAPVEPWLILFAAFAITTCIRGFTTPGRPRG
jgi:4-amino-4-deoxy-L-arabinose transferase-like glycosyltransferase